MTKLIVFLASAITQGTPLLFGATGEIITEKSGNLNLGIPGIMYIGGISGVIGGFFYQLTLSPRTPVNSFLAILITMGCCLLGSLLASLIYAFLTITLRANQNVTGLALTTFGVGLGNFFGGSLIKITNASVPFVALTKISKVFTKPVFTIENPGWFAKIFLSHGFMVYLAVIIAIVCGFVFRRTQMGLHLRAVGENPATADAAGINVTLYKYLATCIGGMIAGLGGLFFVIDYSKGIWSNNGFGDRGWLALALVIFVIWKPYMAIPGSYIFGALYILSNYVNVDLSTKPLMEMLPFVMTVVVLIITSLRKKKEHQPPASLGQSYFREDR